MIPIPANIKLIVLIVLVGGIAALQAIEHLMPTWSWIGGTVQVLSVIEAYLTVRGSTLTELKALRAEAAKAAAAGAKIAGPIVVLLGLGALVTTETGCPVADCGPQEAAAVIDIIGALTDSPKFAAAHPAAVTALKASVLASSSKGAK